MLLNVQLRFQQSEIAVILFAKWVGAMNLGHSGFWRWTKAILALCGTVVVAFAALLSVYQYFSTTSASLYVDVYPVPFRYPSPTFVGTPYYQRIDFGDVWKDVIKKEGNKINEAEISTISRVFSDSFEETYRSEIDIMRQLWSARGLVRAEITNNGSLPAEDVRFRAENVIAYAIDSDRDLKMLPFDSQGAKLGEILPGVTVAVLAWTDRDLAYNSWFFADSSFHASHKGGVAAIIPHIPVSNFLSFMDRYASEIAMMFFLTVFLVGLIAAAIIGEKKKNRAKTNSPNPCGPRQV